MSAATITIQPTQSKGVILGDLSVKEVAKRLGIGSRTITRLINEGRFPNAYKLNPYATRRAEWRIPEKDVRAFEEKRKE